MEKVHNGKSLFQYMEENDRIQYGGFVSEKEILKLLDLEYPKLGTKKEFKEVDFAILSATDYVRNILLGRGMAFAAFHGDYRILLLSETSKYIEKYMASATKKLQRALKLSRNAPIGVASNSNNSLLASQIQSIKDAKRKQENIQ